MKAECTSLNWSNRRLNIRKSKIMIRLRLKWYWTTPKIKSTMKEYS